MVFLRPARVVVLWSLLAVGPGCGPGAGDLEILLSASSPVAVGAGGTIRVRDGCTPSRNLENGCTAQDPRIVSFEVDPPHILDANLESSGVILFRALAPGTARVTVVAASGLNRRQLTGEVRLLNADRIELEPMRLALDSEANHWVAAPTPCTTPYLFQTGIVAQFSYRLFAGKEALPSGGVCPLESEGVEGEARCTTAETLTLTLRETAGAYTLRSPLDPGFALPFELVAPGEVDGVQLLDAFKLVKRKNLWAPALRQGRALCSDKLLRTFVMPEGSSCQVIDRSKDDPADRHQGPGPYELWQPGSTCNVQVGLSGTQLFDEREYPL
jgi:hypothetical protein